MGEGEREVEGTGGMEGGRETGAGAEGKQKRRHNDRFRHIGK